MKTPAVFSLSLLLAGVLPASPGEPIPHFRAVALPEGKSVTLADGLKVVAGVGEPLREESFADPVFGAGQRRVFSRRTEENTGGEIAFETYAGLPFTIIRTTVKNTTDKEVDYQKISPVSFALGFAKPASELVTMGTGGLLAPDANPGSYLFLTCADPATREGVVAGWLTQNKGSGAVFSKTIGREVALTAQAEHGHLILRPGESATLDAFAIGRFADARLGAEALASVIAKANAIRLRPRRAAYCTWYAEGHGGPGSRASTLELADFCAAQKLGEYGLGVIQIDDGWQSGGHFNGPKRGFLEPDKKGPYREGFAEIAKKLDSQGFTLGLWTTPFARNFQDPEYTERQDWFASREDGKPYDTSWGGTCLDLTHPAVRAQLAELAKRHREWGVRYFKLDALWTGAACELNEFNDGYKDERFGNNRPLSDRTKTNVEAYRSGLALLRENAGDDVFFSGCCISQNQREMTALGLVDAMRVGPDFNQDGLGALTGPLRGSRMYFLNGKVWWNDPDPARVNLPIDQSRLIASWVAISDQFYLVSDWLPKLAPERLEILKRTMASHGATTRPADYFDHDMADTWLVSSEKSGVRRDVVGAFNFGKQSLKIDYSFAKLGLTPGKTYHGFDFWENKPVADLAGAFTAELPPMSCRVLALRETTDHPVLVSTSRHVSQGVLEVRRETWKDEALSGVSQIIGGDPCELRIAGLKDGKGRRFLAAQVSPADAEAGVKIETTPSEEGWLRLRVTSPLSRDVTWSAKFE